MKNRISVLFSVILGALLITSCSNVLQPNKKVADIQIKASVARLLAREVGTSADGSGSDTATGTVETEIPVTETTDNTSDDPYSFIDEMLASSDISEEEEFFIYYQIISTLRGPDYNLTEEQAYDILIDKLMEREPDYKDYAGFENFWIQLTTDSGQETGKVYPYSKMLGSIKDAYKVSIKLACRYYGLLTEMGIDLSNGMPDEAALKMYFMTHPDAIEEFQKLSEEMTVYYTNDGNLPDYNFDLTTVSLKLNSVPFDQEVTFTLLISNPYVDAKEPYKYEFTRFVNPGLNVFDITPGQTTATGGDGQNDDNGNGQDGTGGEGTTTVIIEDDDDTDPWAEYTTYYVSNSPAEAANGSEEDPMSLTAAFTKCTKSYEETGTKYAIILTEDITLSETCTVPESAYIVITGNYDTPTKTISAASSLENNMFSIDNYANLGLSSVILNGMGRCQLFYCSNSASEEETVTVSEEDTVTVSEEDTVTATNRLTGTLTMENCTVTGFLGTEKAGIITMATGGKMTISGCTFVNNTVRDTGAIYINNGTLNLNGHDLLDSTLSTLDTINTNSFTDPYATVSEIPCEIYLKGTGIFNDTNIFLNSNLYAVHVAGWATLSLNGTYYSENGDEEVLYIYSSTDGSLSDEDPGINTIEVDVERKVNISDGGDKNGNKETPTYEVITYQDQVVFTE